MVWGPLHMKHQAFHGICVQDEVVTAKINAQASTPVPHPLGCEIAISRLKIDGVEVIMASHIF